MATCTPISPQARCKKNGITGAPRKGCTGFKLHMDYGQHLKEWSKVVLDCHIYSSIQGSKPSSHYLSARNP